MSVGFLIHVSEARVHVSEKLLKTTILSYLEMLVLSQGKPNMYGYTFVGKANV